MRFRCADEYLAVVVLAIALGASPAHGQNGIGFRFAFGYQDMAGDMGDVLDGHVDAELSSCPWNPTRAPN